MNLWDVSQDQIVEALQRNAAAFPLLEATWLPVMRERLLAKGDASEDSLVNPMFRWWFLGRTEKLGAFEDELHRVTSAGIVVPAFAEKLMREVGSPPTAHQAHDRMLDARAELRGLLLYAREGHRVTLEPEQASATHDFNALDAHGDVAVEAKFVRRSDKVGAYLHRWLESQTELTQSDLFALPLIHFRWQRNVGREDLNAEEMAALNAFLRRAAEDHRTEQTLTQGRIDVRYQYREALPLPSAYPPPDLVTALIEKVQVKVSQAWDRQLVAARSVHRPIACYVLVNLDDDPEFYQGDECQRMFSALTSAWEQRGLRVIIDADAHYI